MAVVACDRSHSHRFFTDAENGLLWAVKTMRAYGSQNLPMYRRYKATAPGLDPGVEADSFIVIETV